MDSPFCILDFGFFWIWDFGFSIVDVDFGDRGFWIVDCPFLISKFWNMDVVFSILNSGF